MIGMIADDVPCPGSGGDQGSTFPKMPANDEKGGLGPEMLQNIQDSGSMQGMGTVVESQAYTPAVPFPEYLAQEGPPGVGDLV